MVKRIGAMLILAVVLTALLIYSQQRHEPASVSGFIEAHQVRIGSRVGGRVAKVLSQEGDHVSAGQALIELEPFDLLQRKAQAVAQLALNRQRLDELKAGPRNQDIDAARGELKVAESQAELARISWQRIKDVFEKGASSKEEMDRATATLDGARGAEQAAKARLDLLLAGTRREQIAQAQAAVESAEASCQALETQITELTIRASVDGEIESLDLRPGDLVAANAPVLTLIDGSERWVRAYVPQSRLDIKLDQALAVTVDSFPGRTFQGKVTFISQQGEFTPRNVQTPEERSKQVFRIKVTLPPPPEGQAEQLRPGMTADVWLEDQP
ncbi:MAG: HlyD family efflux transporter periplasmic adaptor subunit [Phycisphaeraceae bacterium]|nr:HlyD family efflux transporter periplasmic adaptor subunit [Phycisphaeraceae bacterium]